jgi:hypothetical protein
MFGQRASNDNFTKESDIISGSFIASATNTITQLNTQLAKLQESSKAIVKSMVDAVNKIKMVDRDMSQRFKKLNADITASRPDFGKFLYKAPPLPLAEIAPGSIQQGKLANTAGLVPPGGGGGGGPLEKILEAAAAAAGLAGAGATARGAGARTPSARAPAATTQTPRAPSPETPKAAGPKAPAGAPEVTKPSASVPSAGSRTGAPTPVEMAPEAKPSGAPTQVGKGKAVLGSILKGAGAALGPLAVGIQLVDSYAGYKAATDAYDAAIANGVEADKAMKNFKADISEIIGEQLGIFLGGAGGAKLGAMAGTVGGPVGVVAGLIGGGVAGSMAGGTIGKLAGQALGDSLVDGSDFTENLKSRTNQLLKQKEEEAKVEEDRRLLQAGPTQRQRTKKTLDSLGQTPADQKQGATAAPATPPPASPPGGAEAGEEGGERGTTSAPTGEATPDKTNVTGAPSAAAPTPTTPSAPPPAPRPNQGAGGADVIVNKTTNMSSSSSSGEGQNVTNPNMKMDAHNPFIKDSLARQVLPEHN